MSLDAIALCARGEAAWHHLAYAGLGQRWTNDGQLARGYGVDVPQPFLLGAVTLTPAATVPDEVPGIVCDSFARLRLPGRIAEPVGHWMIRGAGRAPEAHAPRGLTVRMAVTDEDVEWFEALAFLSADGQPPSRTGELHPAGSQRLPGLTLLIAERDGEGVGTALSVADGVVNNIGAVAVMEAQRGLGIGSALTAAAIAVRPELHAVLSATDLGRGAYRRLGFTDVGRPLHHRPG